MKQEQEMFIQIGFLFIGLFFGMASDVTLNHIQTNTATLQDSVFLILIILLAFFFLIVVLIPTPFFNLIEYLQFITLTLKRKRKKKIGILNSNILNKFVKSKNYPFHTKFVPSDYFDFFKSKGFDVKLISPRDSFDNYISIINPYGECFLEEDLENLLTYNKILKYIESGGIFFNSSGLPFFYCFNEKYNVYKILASESVYYQKKSDLLKPVTLPFSYSFEDSKIRKDFNVFFDTTDIHILNFYQDAEDKIISKSFRKNKQINSFRAIRSNTRAFRPIIRIKSDLREEQYPICLIKKKKGYLFYCGINLTKGKNLDYQFNITCDSLSGFIIHLIEDIKDQRNLI